MTAPRKDWQSTILQDLGSGQGETTRRAKARCDRVLRTSGAVGGSTLLVGLGVLLDIARDVFIGSGRWHTLFAFTIGAVFFGGTFALWHYLVLNHRKLWLWLIVGCLSATASIILAAVQIGLDRAHIPCQLRPGFAATIPLGMGLGVWLVGFRAWRVLVVSLALHLLAFFATQATAQAHIPTVHPAVAALWIFAAVGAVVGDRLTRPTLAWIFEQHHLVVGDFDWLVNRLRPYEHLGFTVRQLAAPADLAFYDLTPYSVVYVRSGLLKDADRAALRRRGCTVVTVPAALRPGLRRPLFQRAQRQRLWE